MQVSLFATARKIITFYTSYSVLSSTDAAPRLYAGARDGGVQMSDGYDVCNKNASANKPVHIGCWALCRRYFSDAMQALPKANQGPE